jgi:hypothetical protein
MLYSEIIAVCSQIYTKHINTLCGQNVELLNFKLGSTHSNHITNKLAQAVSNRSVTAKTPFRSQASQRMIHGGPCDSGTALLYKYNAFA